jgi:hypothetical protein
MRRIGLYAALLAPAVLLACQTEDAPDYDPAASDPPAVAPPATDPGPGMDAGQRMNVPLSPVAGSGVSGDADIMEHGGQTMVVLELRGAPGEGTHQAHIHQGTCDAPGQAVAPLDPVTTDGTGSGSSSSTIDVPFDQVFNGQHIIAAHEAGGQPGSPVACGALPAQTM